jgi:lipid II isoglutaminyl synthase (glutamine-hydrolysing)
LLFTLAIIAGRLTRFAVRMVRPGGGSALPGLVLSKIAPGLLTKVFSGFDRGLVVITGSAGKSTTTKMVVAIVRAHGLSVFTNPSTANIEQGFFSSILERSNLAGKIAADIAIIEMDESHAASIVKRVKPRFVTILNVLEDQLDRFGDPANVRNDLGRVAQAATEGVALNADDQNLLLMLTEFEGVANVTWFGLNQALLSTARAGLGTAPTYLAPLERPDSATTGVAIHENQLDVEMRTGTQIQVGLPNRGLHFAVDAVAALETAQRLLGSRFDGHLAAKVLSELPPVFARGELKAVGDEMVEFILVQNPPSFQLNLDNLTTDPEQIMLAIGTDVHDPSWMWTVDLKNLSHVDIVSGYNSSEAALLLAYSEIPVGAVVGDLDEALSAFLALPKPSRGVKTIIFSADSMRRTRRALGFTDPEDVVR